MKGLIVWAQSACRSQMALYRELGRALRVPLIVPVWFYKKTEGYIDNRNAVGFCDDEFADMTVIPVGEDYQKGLKVLDSHPGWTHLFCNYQGSAVFRQLQLEAYRRGEHTAIGSEAPCNMFYGIKRFLKEVYFRTKLKTTINSVVKCSEFFVNYSGDDEKNVLVAGWPKEKILPLGYFPPPIPGTKCVKRTTNRPFEILATGAMLPHRGVDVLVKALVLLKNRGVPFHATITQKGPLLESVRKIALKEQLPVDFSGFMEMNDLRKAYETCAVYVGSGRDEPWGMRLNDALNCGAPLVVSEGMGGVKMVREYGCGLAFKNENPKDLADQLEHLASDEKLYAVCAEGAVRAAEACSPENKAKELLKMISERFPQWLA